jgi:hypothetical protein
VKRAKLTSLAPIAALLLSFCACSEKTPTNPTPTPDPIAPFTGVWRSPSGSGACTALNWSVAAATPTTATIIYTATCAGIPVTGTANGTVVGTTMNWSATGIAANSCAYTISGTATPATIATDLNVTYNGNVCGTPVSGSDTLHR